LPALFVRQFIYSILRNEMLQRIDTINEKRLIGSHRTMSFADNQTFELWHSFMPRLKEIVNRSDSNLFSIEVYNNPEYFLHFNPATTFVKWAAVEVSSHEIVPPGMELLIIPAGAYAVFLHRGPASEGEKTYRYIFETWLPASGYTLDNRPHFAVMGDKYKNNHPESEEEIWIPVKHK
jgi:AraC family transcriptional regulator